MPTLKSLADFFGLKRNLVILLIAIFVIGAGEELWMRFVPKYLQAVGATVFVIGLYDALRTLVGAIYAYPGGILIDRFGIIPGVRIALVVSVFFSAGAIFLQRQLREEPKERVQKSDRWNFWRSLREFNSPMRRLLLSDILIRFCERIPYAWVVIFAMDYIGVSAKQVGVLTTVEMLAATLCIIPASHYADRYGREPFVILTFIMFTLFPVNLLVARGFPGYSFPLLLVAFVIRGFKEFGDTSRKALIIGYCDPARCGQMVGTYYLVRDLIVSPGAILGAYLWNIGA